MGWGFIFTSFALYMGFHVLDLLFATFHPSSGLASAIQLTYALAAFVYLASSLVLAAKIILGRDSPSH